MDVVNYLMENKEALMMAFMAVISATIAVSLLIPGEQPEKFLQSVLEFMKKFSKK